METSSAPTATAPASTLGDTRAPRLSGLFADMSEAIKATSPPEYTFALAGDCLDGDWRLEGTVDDGTGPGRLFVTVTRRSGMLTRRPCADEEFSPPGVECTEETLADGSLLALRGVIDYRGQRTTAAVLRHPDGSGTGTESGNYVIPEASPGGTVGRPGGVEITRSSLLYTSSQLGRVVEAVDARTRSN